MCLAPHPAAPAGMPGRRTPRSRDARRAPARRRSPGWIFSTPPASRAGSTCTTVRPGASPAPTVSRRGRGSRRSTRALRGTALGLDPAAGTRGCEIYNAIDGCGQLSGRSARRTVPLLGIGRRGGGRDRLVHGDAARWRKPHQFTWDIAAIPACFLAGPFLASPHAGEETSSGRQVVEQQHVAGVGKRRAGPLTAFATKPSASPAASIAADRDFTGGDAASTAGPIQHGGHGIARTQAGRAMAPSLGGSRSEPSAPSGIPASPSAHAVLQDRNVAGRTPVAHSAGRAGSRPQWKCTGLGIEPFSPAVLDAVAGALIHCIVARRAPRPRGRRCRGARQRPPAPRSRFPCWRGDGAKPPSGAMVSS